MKKISFGISVALAAIAVSTLTTSATNQQRDDETVGKISTNQWMIIDPAEVGNLWDCFSGGTACTGVLKPNATPNIHGYYEDDDVNFEVTYTHYEEIP